MGDLCRVSGDSSPPSPVGFGGSTMTMKGSAVSTMTRMKLSRANRLGDLGALGGLFKNAAYLSPPHHNLLPGGEKRYARKVRCVFQVLPRLGGRYEFRGNDVV